MPIRPSGPVGTPPGELRPGAAGVRSTSTCAAGAAAVEAPRRAAPLIGRGIEHLVVRRIHHQFGGAGVLVDDSRSRVQVSPPSVVLIDAAIAAAAPQAAERRHVDDVVIDRVDDDAGDVPRVAQAHVPPRLAAVGGLVDAIAPRAALAVVVLAAADPHRVGVVGVDRDVADRHHVIQIVEVHGPRGAVIHRLPQAAGGRADVEHRRVRLEHREVVDAAAHGRRTDVPELEAREWIGWRGRGRRGRRPLLRMGLDTQQGDSEQHGCQGETGEAQGTHTHAKSSFKTSARNCHPSRAMDAYERSAGSLATGRRVAAFTGQRAIARGAIGGLRMLLHQQRIADAALRRSSPPRRRRASCARRRFPRTAADRARTRNRQPNRESAPRRTS